MKSQSRVQHKVVESKSGRVFQYARRVAVSAPGKLLLAVAVMGSLISIPLLTEADDRDDRDREEDERERFGHDDDRNESRIQQGFAIAPVPLDLQGKNRALVGLGSYIVNAQGFCNDCHTSVAPEFVPGGNPHLGQPEQIDPERYLIGGRQFGPIGVGARSRNLTPDPVTGLPAGYTFEQFLHVIRTGEDLKHLPPHVPSTEIDLLQTMPWPPLRKMTDRDIRAIYEYLRSVPSRPGFFGWDDWKHGPFYWVTQPGDRHGRRANLSFLDGHVASHRWLFTPKRYAPGGMNPPQNALDRQDLMWIIDRMHVGQYRKRVLGIP